MQRGYCIVCAKTIEKENIRKCSKCQNRTYCDNVCEKKDEKHDCFMPDAQTRERIIQRAKEITTPVYLAVFSEMLKGSEIKHPVIVANCEGPFAILSLNRVKKLINEADYSRAEESRYSIMIKDGGMNHVLHVGKTA